MARRGVQWLDRELIRSSYCIGLCRTPKAFRRELKRLRIPANRRPDFIKPDHADAAAHFFERKGDRGRCVIVCLGSTKGRSKIEVYGLLTHEAVHIWQAIREDIGEHNPSSEFEAYSIQAIAQRLMEAY